MKRVFISLLGLSLLLVGVGLYFSINQSNKTNLKNISQKLTNAPTIVPSPTPVYPYQAPEISKQESYQIVLVGDSMIAALGHANELRDTLKNYYLQSNFSLYNYGFGATNITTLPKRLNEPTIYLEESFPPILAQDFDLIIIGSFAYNPLSHLPLEQGLAEQNQILDQVVRKIIKQKPNSVIVFATPIAPNKEKFAQGVYDLSTEKRITWAEERIAYIENHIQFANQRNIPLINVYQKSLTEEGNGNLKYINPDDYIHPSEQGVSFMSQTIAEFIYQNKIFPNSSN